MTELARVKRHANIVDFFMIGAMVGIGCGLCASIFDVGSKLLGLDLTGASRLSGNGMM